VFKFTAHIPPATVVVYVAPPIEIVMVAPLAPVPEIIGLRTLVKFELVIAGTGTV
jgi:hypothetical protein